MAIPVSALALHSADVTHRAYLLCLDVRGSKTAFRAPDESSFRRWCHFNSVTGASELLSKKLVQALSCDPGLSLLRPNNESLSFWFFLNPIISYQDLTRSWLSSGSDKRHFTDWGLILEIRFQKASFTPGQVNNSGNRDEFRAANHIWSAKFLSIHCSDELICLLRHARQGDDHDFYI